MNNHKKSSNLDIQKEKTMNQKQFVQKGRFSEQLITNPEETVTMASLIDVVVTEGGTWEQLTTVLESLAKVLGYGMRPTKTELKKHINSRVKAHPTWLVDRHLVVTEKGIEIKLPTQDKRQSLIDYVKRNGPVRFTDLKRAAKKKLISFSPKTISKVLPNMVWQGTLVKVSKGLYDTPSEQP